jgi:pimeloyl-ACP methyl ester carboxylesterase
MVTGIAEGTPPIWYEDLGSQSDPLVLLVMGQGADAMGWDDDICAQLRAAGYRVVRFDNRDVGLSGDSDVSDYLIADLATDAVRLLDHLDVATAHVVGQSMGGMIAQQLAIDAPTRVASLSLLSTSPDLSIAPPDPAVLSVAQAMDSHSRDAWMDAAISSLRMQTGPRWTFDEELVRARVEATVQRAFRPAASIRQMRAILRSPPRIRDLRQVDAPTLVVHGSDDPVLPIAHAQELAAAIPHAHLVVVDGMGHAVPWGHWDVILDVLMPHLAAARLRSR